MPKRCPLDLSLLTRHVGVMYKFECETPLALSCDKDVVKMATRCLIYFEPWYDEIEAAVLKVLPIGRGEGGVDKGPVGEGEVHSAKGELGWRSGGV